MSEHDELEGIDIEREGSVEGESQETHDEPQNGVTVTTDDTLAEEPHDNVVADKPLEETKQEVSTTEGQTPVVKKPKKHLLFGVIVAILIVVGILFWVFRDTVTSWFAQKPSIVATNAQTASTSQAQKQDSLDPALATFVTPKTGETWLTTPKDMTAQGWLRVELLSNYQDIGVGTSYFKSAKEQLQEATPTYKEVGSRAGNTVILVSSPYEGAFGMYYLFEKHPDGSVAIIVKPQEAGTSRSTSDMASDDKDAVTSKVTIFDQTTRYDSLNLPEKIALDNQEFVTRPDTFWLDDAFAAASGTGVTSTLVKQLGGSSLYRVETKYSDTKLTNIGYYMQLPIGTKVGLKYEPNQLSLQGYTFDDKMTMQYKNSEGQTVYDTINALARGCGGSTAAITRSDALSDADIVAIGKTNTGRDVYDLKDKNNSLYVKAYDEYKQSYMADAVSFTDYVKNHAFVVIKDAKGELLVYVRSKYAPARGCAKPVVYLYPTEQTLVNVKVGAQVTVSDPFYTTNGWKNVLARPDGQLTYQGKTYDSLFWEGQGYGSYPSVTSGTVVRRDDAAATIRKQLAQQGLNTKETNDFMAFWESKIPNKPYIRLTWFGTAQMNALAPLQVTPKPDTTIRVFLDMDGCDTPIALPAQKLNAVQRNGFTVVEWGGLTAEVRH